MELSRLLLMLGVLLFPAASQEELGNGAVSGGQVLLVLAAGVLLSLLLVQPLSGAPQDPLDTHKPQEAHGPLGLGTMTAPDIQHHEETAQGKERASIRNGMCHTHHKISWGWRRKRSITAASGRGLCIHHA